MPDIPDWLQWPAFLASILGAWWVGSRSAQRRNVGFWILMLSNALWALWGWSTGAWALVTLQACLAVTNVRGSLKAER
ncbi:MAG: hypothetical protein LBJ40_17390 [Delftia acidovorans]|jgi:hypothetical protein|uniref:hypothetical protein n=1 Tax=Delftia acidovorans TaxID=80866 RepID=UPI002835567C|nr:hypothetical protein [Delftia acidovorans]